MFSNINTNHFTSDDIESAIHKRPKNPQSKHNRKQTTIYFIVFISIFVIIAIYDIKKLSSEINKLSFLITNHEKQIDSLDLQITETQSEISTLQVTKGELDSQLYSTTTSLNEAKTALSNFENKIKDIQSKIAEISDNIENSKHQNLILKQQLGHFGSRRHGRFYPFHGLDDIDDFLFYPHKRFRDWY